MAALESQLTIALKDEASRAIEAWVARLEAAAGRMEAAAAPTPPRFVLSFGPLEEEDFLLALNGWKWRRVCEDLDASLRSALKYSKRTARTAGLERAREMLHETIAALDLALYP